MQPLDMNTQMMMWKAPLVRLTYVAHPCSNEGKPSTCFVDPQMIASITRQRITNKDEDGKPVNQVDATIVGCCHFALYVEESPEVVAMLRDKALGHEVGPKSA